MVIPASMSFSWQDYSSPIKNLIKLGVHTKWQEGFARGLALAFFQKIQPGLLCILQFSEAR